MQITFSNDVVDRGSDTESELGTVHETDSESGCCLSESKPFDSAESTPEGWCPCYLRQ